MSYLLRGLGDVVPSPGHGQAAVAGRGAPDALYDFRSDTTSTSTSHDTQARDHVLDEGRCATDAVMAGALMDRPLQYRPDQ